MPTNAELTAQVEALTAERDNLAAENTELKDKLSSAGEVEPDPSAADIENLQNKSAALAEENDLLKAELARTREQRDEIKSQAAAASHDSAAVQESAPAPGTTLNPAGQPIGETAVAVAHNATDLQTDSEPCAEHFSKGWPVEEPGATVSCPHGRWIYGQTPKTGPQE